MGIVEAPKPTSGLEVIWDCIVALSFNVILGLSHLGKGQPEGRHLQFPGWSCRARIIQKAWTQMEGKCSFFHAMCAL